MVLLNKWGTHAVSIFAWGEACDRSSGLRLVQLAHDDGGIAVGLKFPRSLPRQKADERSHLVKNDFFGSHCSDFCVMGIGLRAVRHTPSMSSLTESV